mgnify:CR=1 FL=1|jgi:hypothetical protein
MKYLLTLLLGIALFSCAEPSQDTRSSCDCPSFVTGEPLVNFPDSNFTAVVKSGYVDDVCDLAVYVYGGTLKTRQYQAVDCHIAKLYKSSASCCD